MSAIPEWEVWLDAGAAGVDRMYIRRTLIEAETLRLRWEKLAAGTGYQFFIVRGER